MLSLISLCFYSKLNENLSLVIGSLAAAQSVETTGNKNSIDKVLLMKSLKYLLK